MVVSRRALAAVALAWGCALPGLSVQAAERAAAAVDFAGETASTDARYAAEWVVRTHDHRGMPFVIVTESTQKWPHGSSTTSGSRCAACVAASNSRHGCGW